MIRIDMIRQDTNLPDKRRRHQGRAWCEVNGRRYETKGPGAIYKLCTLLYLNGHLGEGEVWIVPQALFPLPASIPCPSDPFNEPKK